MKILTLSRANSTIFAVLFQRGYLIKIKFLARFSVSQFCFTEFNKLALISHNQQLRLFFEGRKTTSQTISLNERFFIDLQLNHNHLASNILLVVSLHCPQQSQNDSLNIALVTFRCVSLN